MAYYKHHSEHYLMNLHIGRCITFGLQDMSDKKIQLDLNYLLDIFGLTYMEHNYFHNYWDWLDQHIVHCILFHYQKLSFDQVVLHLYY
jgi:hypothetical protein